MNHHFERYFRQSKSSNPAWNATKTLIQTVFFWGLFLYVIPTFIYWLETQFQLPPLNKNPRWAIFIFTGASILGLISGLTIAVKGSGTPLPLNCTQKLVIQGPYKYVRNPMAIAGLSQGIAVSLWLGSWLVIVYVIAGMLIWDQIVRPVEENDLRVRFQDEYEDYCREIKCWIPKFPGYSGRK